MRRCLPVAIALVLALAACDSSISRRVEFLSGATTPRGLLVAYHRFDVQLPAGDATTDGAFERMEIDGAATADPRFEVIAPEPREGATLRDLQVTVGGADEWVMYTYRADPADQEGPTHPPVVSRNGGPATALSVSGCAARLYAVDDGTAFLAIRLEDGTLGIYRVREDLSVDQVRVVDELALVAAGACTRPGDAMAIHVALVGPPGSDYSPRIAVAASTDELDPATAKTMTGLIHFPLQGGGPEIVTRFAVGDPMGVWIQEERLPPPAVDEPDVVRITYRTATRTADQLIVTGRTTTQTGDEIVPEDPPPVSTARRSGCVATTFDSIGRALFLTAGADIRLDVEREEGFVPIAVPGPSATANGGCALDMKDNRPHAAWPSEETFTGETRTQLNYWTLEGKIPVQFAPPATVTPDRLSERPVDAEPTEDVVEGDVEGEVAAP